MADLVLVDDPRPAVRRLTLSRPDKRNALSNALTPVIAQVHGYCLAGGTELATACDLV
jgi:enoyl-CoA hydratase/carnithine racemase